VRKLFPAGPHKDATAMHRPPHILNASTNLLGICFVIIGGLKFTNSNPRTYADEVAWAAAFFLFFASLTSYVAIRSKGLRPWQVIAADWTFIAGLTLLGLAVLVAAVEL
jgi:hypothetical protein